LGGHARDEECAEKIVILEVALVRLIKPELDASIDALASE